MQVRFYAPEMTHIRRFRGLMSHIWRILLIGHTDATDGRDDRWPGCSLSSDFLV
jgi:hypothetical protein